MQHMKDKHDFGLYPVENQVVAVNSVPDAVSLVARQRRSNPA
jgi:hypothetical protein